ERQILRVGVIRIRGQTVAETLGKCELKRVIPAFPERRSERSHGPGVLRVGLQRLADRLILREIGVGGEVCEAYGRQSCLLRRSQGRYGCIERGGERRIAETCTRDSEGGKLRQTQLVLRSQGAGCFPNPDIADISR